MKRSWKRLFESLAYRGLEPDEPLAVPRPPAILRSLSRRLEPILYRGLRPEPGGLRPPWTAKQKFELALAALVGCALGAGLLMVLGRNPRPVTKAAVDVLTQRIELEPGTSLEVASLEFQGGGAARVIGTIRNKARAPVRSADLVIDLLDQGGTKLGSVTTSFQNVQPLAVVPFGIPVTNPGVKRAMVRELR